MSEFKKFPFCLIEEDFTDGQARSNPFKKAVFNCPHRKAKLSDDPTKTVFIHVCSHPEVIYEKSPEGLKVPEYERFCTPLDNKRRSEGLPSRLIERKESFRVRFTRRIRLMPPLP
jgi:hypothetical protein